MKFAHIADSHLGAWRQEELSLLNLLSFQKAIDECLREKVDFVLFTGDLFDNPFPSIEILKETFHEFRRLKDAKIKCFMIAGSHDYSVSGKTFLDVLEKGGFCEICKHEINQNNNSIILHPAVFQSYYIYGYPGKKSGFEVDELKKIQILENYKDHFRILMLHTTIKEAAKEVFEKFIDLSALPKADYYALGHIHVDFEREINGKPAIYAGPTFPNNFKELEELKYGKLYIVSVEGFTKITKKEIMLKEPLLIDMNIESSLAATEKIINMLSNLNIEDKIILLKVSGELKKGKPSDIKFQDIRDFAMKKGAYSFLKNISQLDVEKKDIESQIEKGDMDKIEEILVKKYEKENPSVFNKNIFELIESLSIEKQEGENSQVFESRLVSEISKILKMDI